MDVKGTPLPVHTLDSLVVLGYTDSLQVAYVYDDNILADALDPRATWPLERPLSLAMRNALFTVTPVNSLLLFARLRDEEMVEQATLLLGMGLYGLLPSLPDPYAADVGWLRRQGRSGIRQQFVIQLLVADVAWTKADADGDPDAVATSFAFAPVAAQSDVFAAWAAAATQVAPVPDPTAFDATFAAEENGSNEIDWERLFQGAEQEQFRLLDVSSNADQMGVSVFWFNSDPANRSDFLLFRTFGVQEGNAATPAYPLQVRDLDLSAEARFVRGFTVPQVSWEPLFNATPPAIGGDPPFGFNLYPDDGGPTRLLNDSVELVPIAPLPVIEFLVRDFEIAEGRLHRRHSSPCRSGSAPSRSSAGPTSSLRHSPARSSRSTAPSTRGARWRADYSFASTLPSIRPKVQSSREAPCRSTTCSRPTACPPVPGRWARASASSSTMNSSTAVPAGNNPRGVPLTRIDFSGYGASVFSHWQNPNAAIAATSQAHFDVFVGRTAGEVIQIRSLLYPWGVHVVRTITIFRASSANVIRYDTGWQAESDGVYDFRYNAYTPTFGLAPQNNPYVFHPGIVGGVFGVRNIRETDAIPDFTATWNKRNGEHYIDVNGVLRTVIAHHPARRPIAGGRPEATLLRCRRGDRGRDERCDRRARAFQGHARVRPALPARGADLAGVVRPAPGRAVRLTGRAGGLRGQRRRERPAHALEPGGRELLRGTPGASRSSWSPPAAPPCFPAKARGASSSMTRGPARSRRSTRRPRCLSSGAVGWTPIRGRPTPSRMTCTAWPIRRSSCGRPVPERANYGFLQSTGTQKALFRLPGFKQGLDEVLGAPPDFADAYRIVNSPGIFPNVQDTLPLALGSFKTKVLSEGYRLLDEADPNKVFEQLLPEGPLYLINETFLKLYVEYAKKDKDGNTTADGHVRYGFDASAADLGKKWLSKVNDIGMVVDLGPLSRLMMIKGKFDAEKGSAPGFIEPEIEFSDALQPVMDILQILLMLQGGDYQAAFQKGLEIAMSNSAESWNYAFHARKEIPLVKFPPGALYDDPLNPLKLEAHMALGVYFNEAMRITGDPNQLVPSAGAFLEFGGRLSVMCVSLAAATVYATGSVDLRTAADVKTGPALHMKFGFGAEVVVGLPVVGDVSLLYMVGVEIDLDSTQITIAGLLLFRGHAEIAGGLVAVTITIEAKGAVQRFPRRIGPI